MNLYKYNHKQKLQHTFSKILFPTNINVQGHLSSTTTVIKLQNIKSSQQFKLNNLESISKT